MNTKRKSDFLEGVASLLTLIDPPPQYGDLSWRDDQQNLADDWGQVSADLWAVICKEANDRRRPRRRKRQVH